MKKNQNNPDNPRHQQEDDTLALQLLLADIDEVLQAHRATTHQVLVCGRQLLFTAVRQLMLDNPACDRRTFLRMLTRALDETLRQIVENPDGVQPVGMA